MSECRNDLAFGFKAFAAHMMEKTCFRTRSRVIDDPTAPLVSVCLYKVLLIGISARTTPEVVSLLGTGGWNCGLGIGVSVGSHVIRAVPLSANGTNVLVISLLGTGRRYPNGSCIDVSLSVVLPRGINVTITCYGHILSITRPTKEVISCLGRLCGKRNR